MSPKILQDDIHPECRTVFLNLRMDKILLETDAPYLGIVGGQQPGEPKTYPTPLSVYTVGRYLAALRGRDLDSVLYEAMASFCAFYNVPIPPRP